MVRKKTKKNVPVKTADNPPAAKPKPVEAKRRGIRTRPSAIVVEVNNEEDFPALVKKIRGGVNPDVIGERVVGMRQTKSGHLLIEIKGDTDEVEAVRVKISKITGDGIEVRSLQHDPSSP